MWTPPPQTVIDEVRTELGRYDESEIIVAWHFQTSKGLPWGMVMLVPAYESINEYLRRNSAAGIAQQIDDCLARGIEGYRDSLTDLHSDECYEEDLLKARQKGQPLPHSQSAPYEYCAPAWSEHRKRLACTYEPSNSEIANEVKNEIGNWSEMVSGEEDLMTAWNIMVARPDHQQLMNTLKHYAVNRRALAEQLERFPV